MDLEKIRSNQFQTICQFSIPAIIAMVLTSMITLADGFFTGNYVGKEGIAAINLGLPIVYLYLGIGLMISVGGSALASRTLGVIFTLPVILGKMGVWMVAPVTEIITMPICLYFLVKNDLTIKVRTEERGVTNATSR